jgi:hypothetical protein
MLKHTLTCFGLSVEHTVVGEVEGGRAELFGLEVAGVGRGRVRLVEVDDERGEGLDDLLLRKLDPLGRNAAPGREHLVFIDYHLGVVERVLVEGCHVSFGRAFIVVIRLPVVVVFSRSRAHEPVGVGPYPIDGEGIDGR